MTEKNYLIGHGELLVEPIDPPAINPTKDHPYTESEARARLAPQLATVVQGLEASTDVAPNEVHVVKFALHPSYVAKSYYPTELFAAAGFEPVGSRDRTIAPEKHTRKDWEEFEYGTSEIFVAGTLNSFRELQSTLAGDDLLPRNLGQIIEIEAISTFAATEKVKSSGVASKATTFELVLHRPSSRLAPRNQIQFLEYAEQLGFNVRQELAFDVRGLWFVPASGPAERLAELARFTTVRVVRPMPTLSVSPILRGGPVVDIPALLPTERASPLSPRVAILDGGLPADHALGPWLESYREMDPTAGNEPGYEQHGLAVAAAFLFGALEEGVSPETPPARVSVFRVLDDSTDRQDPFELYKTLGHVEEILLTKSFEYINLSLGPYLPIDDTEIHAWTALIDELLSDGDTLLTVAVGNNGAKDWESGNGRIQVPGDAVNAVAVGAADSHKDDWRRARYSAVGPGRSPGVKKPDVLAFGGSPGEYFHVLGVGSTPSLIPATGTSLAAPLALRQAVSIRTLLGDELRPLALRALLVHSADPLNHDAREVGWGRIPSTFESGISSGPGVARVVYQGEVKPGKYIRAKVPIPRDGLLGNVRLSASFCFASRVDAQTPDTYTRAALEVRFRPDILNFKEGAKTPVSRAFFSPAAFADESRLRSGEGKWETVMSASENMRGSTLANPVFDIHHIARDEGGASRATDPLKYALVITLEAARHQDLHSLVLNAYPDLLVALEPRVDVEIDI